MHLTAVLPALMEGIAQEAGVDVNGLKVVLAGDETQLDVKPGEHPGDHNHQNFPKSTAIQMGGVLQYKWEAYCDTSGRSTDSISLS